ncbi:hypothetical protein Tco_0163147 [Tanacetum coccineum]
MMRAASLPTHHQLPLNTPSTSRRVDILEADIPPRKRLLLTTHIPRRIMAAIEVVNLRRDRAALHDECQDADDHATRAIMRTQALEVGARVDTLKDTARIALDIVHTTVNSLEVIDMCESLREGYCEEYTRNLMLEAELSKMNELSNKFENLQITSQGILDKQVKSTHCNLKRKDVSDDNNIASVIAPGMFRWLPTGMTFTIIGTQCPLTKLTANPIVPPKETSPTPVLTTTPEVMVYHMRTKVAKSVMCKIVLFVYGLGMRML